jgi:hypothetical protein
MELKNSQPGRIYWPGEAFNLRFTLDLSQVTDLQDGILAYQAIAKARKLGSGRYIDLGEIQGECFPGQEMALTIPVRGLEEGAYRLETAVRVFPAGSSHPEQEGLQGVCEGGLILVQAAGAEKEK